MAVPTGSSQRLGLTSVPASETAPKREMADIETSREVIEHYGRTLKAINLASEYNHRKAVLALLGEATEVAEPYWVPGLMVGQLVDWMLKTGTEIGNALAGDPPRADYQTVTGPQSSWLRKHTVRAR